MLISSWIIIKLYIGQNKTRKADQWPQLTNYKAGRTELQNRGIPTLKSGNVENAEIAGHGRENSGNGPG